MWNKLPAMYLQFRKANNPTLSRSGNTSLCVQFPCISNRAQAGYRYKGEIKIKRLQNGDSPPVGAPRQAKQSSKQSGVGFEFGMAPKSPRIALTRTNKKTLLRESLCVGASIEHPFYFLLYGTCNNSAAFRLDSSGLRS